MTSQDFWHKTIVLLSNECDVAASQYGEDSSDYQDAVEMWRIAIANRDMKLGTRETNWEA